MSSYQPDPVSTEAEGEGRTPSAAQTPAGDYPAHIGRYRVESLLGQGGFGRVYLARDEQLARPVAIKVPHARLVTHAGDAEAYLNEARTVASLDHPNIVSVHDVGSTEQFPCFVVTKYIDGRNLKARAEESRLSLEEAAGTVATVAEALHYAHRQGIVHRDIKPSNILLDRSGKPFVADFGLALREQDVGKGPRYAGTPAYMSPEQARGEGHRVDGRSDIFSLGVVLYELLTGRRPFRADSRDELLEQIARQEARPPRQIDDRIPRELDRICLKALAKRASERYSSALDLADDLHHFLARASGAERSTLTGWPGHAADAATPLFSPAPTPSGSQAVHVVPKGLRSFDAADADFFLELLPGPRDREGLPDSIRFWKARVEATAPDGGFAVGLIYGPSGCGKSSLVKAGLLPRLAKSVAAVYVEATAKETEARLLKGLRRQVPDLPGDLDLVESLTALRQGRFLDAGRKVLLVLDQFEQWLHARRSEENTELVQALRQCDGGRAQCLVMVRDDFWLAVSRFLKELEIRLAEGHNSALVDLFDRDHARKVLAAFGAAFGRLPEKAAERTREQQAFLNQAVSGLAEENKVVCVRLALFAEMFKGRPWTPASLKAVGGTQGVGATFLEETFSAAAAPAEHRYHQKAARAVLQALLPESGTDIKGHMRAYDELLAASGYADRPREFDDLLRVLDGELRLLTPTERGADTQPTAGPRAPAGGQCYQLTHDYLVHSLRDWLTRKQKETRRGRAALLLADRAAVWSARPETRQLPSLLQWLHVRWLTRKADWTPPQRQMMHLATRHHAVRGMAVAAVLVLLGLGGYEGYGRVQAHHLRDRLLEANPADVPAVLDDLAGYRRWVDPLLRDAYDQAEREHDARKQLHASLGLLSADGGQLPYLHDRLLDADPQELAVIRRELTPYKDRLVQPLWGELADGKDAARRLRAACALAAYAPGDPRWARYGPFLVRTLVGENALLLVDWKNLLEPVGDRLLRPLAVAVEDSRRGDAQRRTLIDLYRGFCEGRREPFAPLEARLTTGDERDGRSVDRLERVKRRANVAAALVALGHAEKVWPLLIHGDDSTVRSYLIERLGTSGVDPRTLASRLETEPDVSARRALVLALGGFPSDLVPSLEARLLDLYENDADAGLHAAAGWALRQWGRGERLGSVDHRLATGRVEGRRGWYVNKQGQTFTVLRQPHLPGVEAEHGSPDFAIASTEVTVAQFQQFRPRHAVDPAAPLADCPVNMVSWYDAVAYCNWLSEKEGIDRSQWCYVLKDGKLEAAPGYLKLRGYRLPTEAEWEYACRAGAETPWCCGDGDEDLIGRYARWYGNAQAKGVNRSFPVATLKPNDFGLFDMLGNASEWCQDISESHARELRRLEDAGLRQSGGEATATARGGNFTCPYQKVRCATWGGFFRTLSFGFAGFRPAHTWR